MYSVDFRRILLVCLVLTAAASSARGTIVTCFIACQAIAGRASEPLPQRFAESGPLNSTSSDTDWRLTRIRNPRGGPDTVSIMHSVDLAQSDISLAGLVLRCQTAPDVDTVVVVVDPLPPGSHPKVSLRIGGKSVQFDATVLEPFTALLLPRSATAFLTETWRIAPVVAISIEEASKTTKGAVPIGSLGPAYDELLKSCFSPERD